MLKYSLCGGEGGSKVSIKICSWVEYTKNLDSAIYRLSIGTLLTPIVCIMVKMHAMLSLPKTIYIINIWLYVVKHLMTVIFSVLILTSLHITKGKLFQLFSTATALNL